MDNVVIYVGNPHEEFRTKKSSLEASPLLSRLMNFNDKIGFYVMAPVLSSLSAKDFGPVIEYLDRNEYEPTLFSGHGWEIFGPAVVDLEERRNQETLRCGIVHSIAQQIELPGLQSLAFRKLKASQPYPAFEFLSVLRLMFREETSEIDGLRLFIVQYLADHFRELLEQETTKVLDLIDENAGLARDMFLKLAEMRQPTSVTAPDTGEDIGEGEGDGEITQVNTASFQIYDEA